MGQQKRIFIPGSRCGAAAVVVFLLAAVATAQVNYPLMRGIALERYGEDTALVVDQWRAEIEAMKALPEQDKLQRANQFFNSRIRWVSDTQTWQEKDYWATPLEVMGRGKGDCEDFAIAKYATLILAGVDVNKLRITYVKAKIRIEDSSGADSSVSSSQNSSADGSETGTRNVAHMVLAYYPDASAEPVVLDNLVQDIQAASLRTDLTPVYGFNSLGLWVGGAQSPASTQPKAKLSRWRDVLRRAAQEGLG